MLPHLFQGWSFSYLIVGPFGQPSRYFLCFTANFTSSILHHPSGFAPQDVFFSWHKTTMMTWYGWWLLAPPRLSSISAQRNRAYG